MPYYTIITCQMRPHSADNIPIQYIYYEKPPFIALALRCTRALSLVQSLRPSYIILNHENITRFIIIILLDFAHKRLVSIIIISGGSSTYYYCCLACDSIFKDLDRKTKTTTTTITKEPLENRTSLAAPVILLLLFTKPFFLWSPSYRNAYTRTHV